MKLKNEDHTEYTISIERANIIALIMAIPITIIYGIPYYLLWHESLLKELRSVSLSLFFVSIIPGIIIHELLHGVTWAILAKNGFRSIEFGIKWEYLTPYCHCRESLKVWQYILGSIMPLVFMGILPVIWAMFNGNGLLMLIGTFFTWAAGGDIQAVWLLRKHKLNKRIKDHPNELGFIITD